MSHNITRRTYADLCGPAPGDRVRLADTGLTSVGAQAFAGRLRAQMATPPDSRHTVIDAHAPHDGRPHAHPRTP